MKTIIVATDFSRAADNALEYAAAFARCTASKIVLFNAFQLHAPASSMSFPVLDMQGLIARNKARLQSRASEITHTYGIHVDCASITGSLREELDEAVRRFDAALVVMGVESSSLTRILFGSSTTTVIRHGRYPVLVVPHQVVFQGIAKILFACDYNSLSPQNELPLLTNIATIFKARVQVFHVNQEDELVTAGRNEDAPQLERILRGIRHTYQNLEEDDVVEGIRQGVQAYKPDLLVMVPNKPEFLDSLLNQSNTRKMVFQSHVPMLAIPNPNPRSSF